MLGRRIDYVAGPGFSGPDGAVGHTPEVLPQVFTGGKEAVDHYLVAIKCCWPLPAVGDGQGPKRQHQPPPILGRALKDPELHRKCQAFLATRVGPSLALSADPELVQDHMAAAI